MNKLSELLALAITALITIITIGLLLSLPVMLLWNMCLVDALPAVKPIGWLQAWGIMTLSGLLFKNNASKNKD